MVRLEALATWTRMAGRATLTVEEAMDEARREASTRVEAIVTDGRESCEKRTILDRREGLGELLKTARRTVGLVWMREKMKTEGKRTERRSGERVGHGPTQGKLAASLPASNDLPKTWISWTNWQSKREHTNPLHHGSCGSFNPAQSIQGRKNDAPGAGKALPVLGRYRVLLYQRDIKKSLIPRFQVL